MRWVSDPTGRFAQRPFYEVGELEARCEEALRWFYEEKLQHPFNPPMTDGDLQSLVEAYVEDLDLYADLSAEGPGVEALTEFRPDRGPCIKIAHEVSDNPRRRKRLRTGLSHELGHVLFHSELFTTLWQQSSTTSNLEPVTLQRAICKRDTLLMPRQPDWAEWQAGYACGALLMPKVYLLECLALASETDCSPVRRERGTPAPQREWVVARVAQRFDVSLEAARVRMEVLGIKL